MNQSSAVKVYAFDRKKNDGDRRRMSLTCTSMISDNDQNSISILQIANRRHIIDIVGK